MEQVLIYPFDDSSIAYIKHQNQFSNMTVSSLVSPKGWGLEKKEYVFNGTSYIVSSNFQDSLNKCTAVLFVNSWLDLEFTNDILEKISFAARQGKKILYSKSSTSEEIKKIKTIVPNKNLYIVEKDDFLNQPNNSKIIYDIDTPIILISGESENTDKFDLQLSLRGNFINRGYRTVLVSSRLESKFFGLHTIPSYMLGSKIDEREKIINFNNYIKNIEINENPELIIIGIPGGALSLSRKLKDYFGILHYEISKAVKPDYIIFNLLYNELTKDILLQIENEVNPVFGEQVDLFNMSNYKLEIDESDQYEEPIFLSLSDDYINSKIASMDLPNLCKSNTEDDINLITNKIISKLSSYADIQII